MTLLTFALILAAAVAHAVWNLLTKRSRDKMAFTWCALVAGSVLYAPIAIYFVWREGVAPLGWLFMLGTVFIHSFYLWSLSRSYQNGDLSLVYPVARGTGPVLVPALAVVLLGERVSLLAALGIAVVVVGVFVAHSKGLRPGTAQGLLHALGRPATRYALLTGLSVGVYSVWDKVGVSHVSPPVYNYFKFAGAAVCLGGLVLRQQWSPAQLEWGQNKAAVVAVGFLSPLSYMLVLVVLTTNPVSYIAPTRVLSIPFAALLGALVLREPYGPNRLVGSFLIATGVVALVVAP